jgi:hypothetical protein
VSPAEPGFRPARLDGEPGAFAKDSSPAQRVQAPAVTVRAKLDRPMSLASVCDVAAPAKLNLFLT